MNTDAEAREFPLATREENFYLDWGLETQKQTIPRLNDALQRVITLAAALLGGSLYFSAAEVVPPGFRLGAMASYLLSLAAAVWGSMAVTEDVRLGDPWAVKAFKEKVAARRDHYLRWGYGFLLLGLFVASLGAILKVVNLA